jgi:hypothetical protein
MVEIASHLGSSGGASPFANGDAVTAAAAAAYQQEQIQRFDTLHKQFQDLQAHCRGVFVPREEVHEAMSAVIAEVKLLKKNAVSLHVFKDSLRKKADNEEVDRYMLDYFYSLLSHF